MVFPNHEMKNYQDDWSAGSIFMDIVFPIIAYVVGIFFLLTRHMHYGRPVEIQRLLEFLEQDAILRLFYPIVYVSHIILWPLVLPILWLMWASSAPNICGISRQRARRYLRIPSDVSQDVHGLTVDLELSASRAEAFPLPPSTLGLSHAEMNEDTPTQAAEGDSFSSQDEADKATPKQAAGGDSSSTSVQPPPYEE